MEQDWPPSDWISSRCCSPEVVKRRERSVPELVDAIVAMLPNDEIRRFSSPEESWDMLGGRAGYVIMRNGKVIATFLLAMS